MEDSSHYPFDASCLYELSSSVHSKNHLIESEVFSSLDVVEVEGTPVLLQLPRHPQLQEVEGPVDLTLKQEGNLHEREQVSLKPFHQKVFEVVIPSHNVEVLMVKEVGRVKLDCLVDWAGEPDEEGGQEQSYDREKQVDETVTDGIQGLQESQEGERKELTDQVKSSWLFCGKIWSLIKNIFVWDATLIQNLKHTLQSLLFEFEERN